LPLVAIDRIQNIRHLFLKGEQFLGVLKLQAKARILALKALLLMTDLAVSLRFIFWRKRWVNSQAPSTSICQVAKKKDPRVAATVLVHQAWCCGPRPGRCAISHCG